MLKYVFVFVAIMANEFLWNRYVLSTASRRAPIGTAAWSSSIVLLNGAVVCVYTDNHKTLIAAVAGSFLGAYVSNLAAKRKESP
jgi:uncharacterized membrane protein YfcA